MSSLWRGYLKKSNRGANKRRRDSGDLNDLTNLGRALTVAKREANYSERVARLLPPRWITDNPRHLQIMELEGAAWCVLDDPKVEGDYQHHYIQQTGLSRHDSVFSQHKNSPYVNILVAREDNKNAENVKEFLQSYQSPSRQRQKPF